MPTIFTHAIFATAAGKACLSKSAPHRFWLLTAMCAILPDADVISFAFGFRYGSLFGHRGFTHSLIFALLIGVASGVFAFRKMRTGLTTAGLVIYFSLATLSHPLLDMLTDGGAGVALFAPVSEKRYFFGWRPIEVSPIGVRFFGARGLVVMVSEIVWVWLPALAMLIIAALIRRLKKAEEAS